MPVLLTELKLFSSFHFLYTKKNIVLYIAIILLLHKDKDNIDDNTSIGNEDDSIILLPTAAPAKVENENNNFTFTFKYFYTISYLLSSFY